MAFWFWHLALLVAAIWATIDRGAPLWQRILVPLSFVAALVGERMFLHGKLIHTLPTFADQVMATFTPLLLPSVCAAIWLAGGIGRGVRRGD
jgi:hypothetical protein